MSFNIVSPHLDDGALSCSVFLAAHPGSCVTTVFAGGPGSVRPLTSWDREARYFREGADVVGVRRGEDISAAALVNASTHHLAYWDRQYRIGPYGYRGLPEDELAGALAQDFMDWADRHPHSAWVIPLGLGHPDHRITADAGLIFAGRYSGDVYLYEELPYAAENRSESAGRKARLSERGFALEDDPALRCPHDRALKADVLRCHASQRRPLRRRLRTAVRTPERIWRLVRL